MLRVHTLNVLVQGARVELDVSTENKKDGKRARIELVTVRPR